jgi:Domain of unknown function (DUF4123)
VSGEDIGEGGEEEFHRAGDSEIPAAAAAKACLCGLLAEGSQGWRPGCSGLMQVANDAKNQTLQAVVQRLADEVTESTQTFVYLVVDQSALPNIRKFWSSIAETSWAMILGDADQQPDSGSPFVMDVSNVSRSPDLQKLIRRLQEQAQFANCFCILQSELGCKKIANELRKRSCAELPDHLEVVLRFFDTRTIPLLPKLLSAAQYAQFVACAKTWHYIDRFGMAQLMPPATTDIDAEFVNPMVLNVEQEKLLIQDGLTDSVIDQLLTQRHPALHGLSPPEQFILVERVMNCGRPLGIDDTLDGTLFCYASFEHGQDFVEREPWRARLQQFRRNELSLRAALQYE